MENRNKQNEAKQLKDIILLWLKHWYYFVISFAVLGTIGIIYYVIATPVWNVVAQVSLRHDESLMGSAMPKTSSLMSAFGLGGGLENIEDETLKMKSHGYIKNVVKKLELNKQYIQSECLGFIKTDLFDQSPIRLIVDSIMSDTITKGINFTMDIREDKTRIKIIAEKKTIGKFEVITFPATLKTSWGNFTLEKTRCYDLYKKPLKLNILFTSYDYMAQEYQEDLFIDYEKKTSDLINLGFKSRNVFFAKNILNEVISTYNYEWDCDKTIVSQKTLDFIDGRLSIAKGLLLNADIQIQQFKDNYNLTAIEADVKYYFERTGILQAQLLASETQLKIIDIILDFIQDEQNKYALIPFSLSTDANIASVIGKYNEEIGKRNELYKVNAQTAIAKSLDEQIEMHRANLSVSLENIKRGLQISRDNIKKQEGEFSSKIGRIPTIEREYIALKREQELQQTVNIFLLEMREQFGIKAINLLPKLKIIDSPYVYKKRVSPRFRYVALVVFVLGMSISLSFIYGLPFLKVLRKKEN